MKNVIITDNQDITRLGIIYLLSKMKGVSYTIAANKLDIILHLKEEPQSIVILDYTSSDMTSETDILNISQRYPQSRFILWSEELSADFIRSVVNADGRISVLMKDARLNEIEQCFDYTLHGRRFLCQHSTAILLSPSSNPEQEIIKLTKTETEILKDIALGMTTREIADKRYSSFHTVNTHRKNIFRKLGINNVHEAMRYAMRTGLVDAAEYYI